jgi:hypothetical protein
MRVEIELAVLAALAALAAALAAVVPAVDLFFLRLLNDTVGATPPLRAIVVCPARLDKMLKPLERKLRFAVFIRRSCFQPCSYHVRQVEARSARYVECYLLLLDHCPSDSLLD